MAITKYKSGEKIGTLTFVKECGAKNGFRVGQFICGCGTVFEKPICQVANGSIKSCGCHNAEYRKMTKGDRFGALVFTGQIIRMGKNNRAYGLFDCDCGTKNHPIFIHSVARGKQNSCGCGRSNKHGLTSKNYQRLNQVYQAMKYRCVKPEHYAFNDYGGRGISVCSEWMEDINSFMEWAVQNGYKQGLTIERIDNNGNYEPSNCRWATKKKNKNIISAQIFSILTMA